MTVFLPDPEKANSAAVIICPGGAMRMVGTALYESPDGYLDFVATMDAHFNVTNGCVALYTFWKDAGRPVALHIYDQGSGSGSGMPIANWTDRLYEWFKIRKVVTN